jgi:hypothetical protein
VWSLGECSHLGQEQVFMWSQGECSANEGSFGVFASKSSIRGLSYLNKV